MELALDFRPSTECSVAQRERQRLEQLLGCLQVFVGHELPNMLVPCCAFAQLLGEQVSGPGEETRLLLDRLQELTQKADSWARRLAELGRLLRGSAWGPPVSLSEVAREAVACVKALNERPEVVYRVAEGLPCVSLSRPLLNEVLVQLVRNSSQAILTGSPGMVEVTGSFEQGVCLLQVRDNGRGMTPEQARLLGEPFSAARLPAASGCGLGFFLVRQAIALWGGTLGVQSEVGQGTTVSLGLVLHHLSAVSRP